MDTSSYPAVLLPIQLLCPGNAVEDYPKSWDQPKYLFYHGVSPQTSKTVIYLLFAYLFKMSRERKLPFWFTLQIPTESECWASVKARDQEFTRSPSWLAEVDCWSHCCEVLHWQEARSWIQSQESILTNISLTRLTTSPSMQVLRHSHTITLLEVNNN